MKAITDETAARLIREFSETLEALEIVGITGYVPGRIAALRSLISELQSAPDVPDASPQPEEVCVWREDEDGVWQSECEGVWRLADGGTPAANGVIYCQSCGKPIQAEEVGHE